MTTRTVRPYDPDELWLWPPSPREWLPEDHLAYFLADLVEELNLHPILVTSGGVTRGTAPYHPQLLVTVLLSGYAVGIPASRQIARKREEDVAFRVLAANQRPDFRTLSEFRKPPLTALAERFVQVLKRCQRAGLVKLGHMALEGTKVKANASKHKAMSDGRMVTDEARLQAEVEAWLTQAEAADARDDAAYGPDRRRPSRRRRRCIGGPWPIPIRSTPSRPATPATASPSSTARETGSTASRRDGVQLRLGELDAALGMVQGAEHQPDDRRRPDWRAADPLSAERIHP
jgi:transposase